MTAPHPALRAHATSTWRSLWHSAPPRLALPLTLLPLTALLMYAGCNDHPVERFDQVLSAVNRVENSLPAKTKLDFLFVIDDSGSMCEEQENLTRNFKLFSDFLFDELQGAADYRIAVVSTDIGYGDKDNDSAGSFLYRPASPDVLSCNSSMTGEPPATSDCGAPGSLPPVISPDDIDNSVDLSLPTEERNIAMKAELERQFRCRATLGTEGAIYEKGLEAMRLALSCNGPNKEMFQDCCVNFGQPNAYYNPACQIPAGQPEPTFLRPDATLIVIFISDEDDCSTPQDAPDETSRLICRTGGQVDNDNNGVPDIYQDYCRGSVSPQECYQRECGNYVNEGPSKCREERCDINYTDGIECQWYRSRLTPVREYRDFLQNLKARPLDQLLVATVVGFRSYTELGNELQYNSSPASEECRGDLFEHTERCCPDGDCSGRDVKPACDFAERGILAFPGTRYLQLTEAMGDNGLGCPPGKEPIVDPVARTLMSAPGVDPNECVNICVEDFIAPLQAIKERVASLLNTYCIDRLPACIVPAYTDEAGQVVPERPCVGEEVNNPSYYPIQVSMRCTSANCDEVIPLNTLPRNDWELKLDVGACVAQVVLNSVPPAGAQIFVDFLVDAGSTLRDEGEGGEANAMMSGATVNGGESSPSAPATGGVAGGAAAGN